jgi:hypothetical protein
MKTQLPWDPEMESPASVAVIGGGPIGIEAAIYARFLGYFVSIFEAKRVGHRMLDWHRRPLGIAAGEITTPLGCAAIRAQDPEYTLPNADRIMTGQEYADEYLLPLAKSDLLFDDIHFLSPVVDIARVRTSRNDPVLWQERCNDEFRIVVQGRHRGTWIARADCIIDCRGDAIDSSGMGPGGGLAIGEPECEADLLIHAPGDRKFERKKLEGKHLALVGQSPEACVAAADFVRDFPWDDSTENPTRLTWVIRPRGDHESELFTRTIAPLRENTPRNVILLESLGVDAIIKRDEGGFRIKMLKEDDSSVEMNVDFVMRRTGYRYRTIAPELNVHPTGPMLLAYPAVGQEAGDLPDFFTAEPGYYRIHGGNLAEGAGVGIPRGLEQIKALFARIVGRDDLDLYEIINRQNGGFQ